MSYGAPKEATIQAVKRILGEKIGLEEKTNICGRTETFLTKYGEVIWIWTEKKDVTVLVHEVFHAVWHTLSRKGVSLVDESEEIFAYQIEMLLREILTS